MSKLTTTNHTMSKSRQLREYWAAHDPEQDLGSVAEQFDCSTALASRARKQVHPEFNGAGNVQHFMLPLNVNSGRINTPTQHAQHTKPKPATVSKPATSSGWLSLAPLLIVLVVGLSVYQSTRAVHGSIASVPGALALGCILSLSCMLFHGMGGKRDGLDVFDAIAVLLTIVQVWTGILWFRAESHNQSSHSRGATAELAEYRAIQAEQSATTLSLLAALDRRAGETPGQWQARIGTKDDGDIGEKSTRAHTAKQQAILQSQGAQQARIDQARASAAAAAARAPQSALALGGLGLMFAIQLLVNGLEVGVPRIAGLNIKACCCAGIIGMLIGCAAFLQERDSAWLEKIGREAQA